MEALYGDASTLQIIAQPTDRTLQRSLGELAVRNPPLVGQAVHAIGSHLLQEAERLGGHERNVRRLFDAGLLAVRGPQSPTEENLYVLGPRGLQLARQDGGAGASIPRGGLDHHLAIVETWVLLATLEVPGVALQLARADWELRAEFSGLLTVVPDLFVIFDGPRGQQAMAIEVDLGTEPLKVLRGKLAAYGQLAASGAGLLGWSEFALGLALRGRGRLPYLRELLSESWVGQWCLWCLEDGPGEEIRRLMFGPVTPLASSPCSKGRGGTASSCEATDGDA